MSGSPAIEFEALGFDPAPGDATGTGELAERYRRISTKLRSALEALDAIGSRTGLWEGQAAEAFLGNVNRLPEYLGLAVDSTAAASTALDEWADALGEMRARAYELELAARKARTAAEAARDDPAFGLAWQTFFDPEALRTAQRMLDAASERLSEAVERLEGIQEEAHRLLDEHTETAERIAEQLDEARDLAPDKPRGGVGGVMDSVTGAVGDAVDDVSGFLEDNANLIAAGSRIVGDISMVVGLAGDLPIPVVGEALSAVATGMDLVAYEGLAVARHYGADVTDGELAAAGISLTASALGIIPGVPSTVVEAAGLTAYGLDAYGSAQHFVPQNDRQWAQHGLSVLLGGNAAPSLAVGAENMVGGWGDQIAEAREADEAAREERG